jgi:hypothetical protein
LRHRVADDGVVSRRIDEGAVLEERSLVVDEASKVSRAKAVPEPAPEHQVLRSCHRRGGIELQKPETTDHLQDAAWPWGIKELGHYRELARSLDCQAGWARSQGA